MSIIFEHSEEACHKDVDFAMIVSQGNPVHIDYKEKDFIGDDYYTKPEIDILVKDFKTAEQIRNENELRRIQFEINREYDEDFRQANEIVRIENEDIRIENEKNRQSTFEVLESQATELIDRGTIVINEAEDATDSANEAAEYAILKANEAVSKWQLCGDEPDLPVELWFDCSDDAASLDIYAVEAIGKQAKIDGDYARVQGDYAKELGDKVAGLTQDVEGSVKVVAELIDISIETLTDANAATEGARQSSVEALESANMAKQEAERAANSAESALFAANVAMENSQSAQTAAKAADASAQAAESAASSAISAANQANTQAAFALTQGQFSLQSGKFAEEAGAYAKEQATTIDEKISGKADLYNYYPYEGEVKNGYWDNSGDFVSNLGFVAVEFECHDVSFVYASMDGYGVVHRCIFLKDGLIISNLNIVNVVNYKFTVPQDAQWCRLSTDKKHLDSIKLSNKIVGDNHIIYKDELEKSEKMLKIYSSYKFLGFDNNVLFACPDDQVCCAVFIGSTETEGNNSLFGDLSALRHNGSTVQLNNVTISNGNLFAGVWIDKKISTLIAYDKYGKEIITITGSDVDRLDLTNPGQRQRRVLEFAMFDFNIFENNGTNYFNRYFSGGQFRSDINDTLYNGTYLKEKIYTLGLSSGIIELESLYGDTGRAFKMDSTTKLTMTNQWVYTLDRTTNYKYKVVFTPILGSVTEVVLGSTGRVVKEVLTGKLATFPLTNGVEYECYWTLYDLTGGSISGETGTIIDFAFQERIPLKCHIMVDRTALSSSGKYVDFYNGQEFNLGHTKPGNPYASLVTGVYYKNGQIKIIDNDIYMCVDVTKLLHKKITP